MLISAARFSSFALDLVLFQYASAYLLICNFLSYFFESFDNFGSSLGLEGLSSTGKKILFAK